MSNGRDTAGEGDEEMEDERLTRVREKVRQLFFRTQGATESWHDLEAFLDQHEAWSSDDWNRLKQAGADYLALRGAKQLLVGLVAASVIFGCVETMEMRDLDHDGRVGTRSVPLWAA